MAKSRRSHTTNDRTHASHPGQLRINPLQWVRNYPRATVIHIVGFSAFFGMAVLLPIGAAPFLVIGATLFVVLAVMYWFRIRDQFQFGCINPAVVVSVEPMLIAVVTDLSKGIGKYPVIKIIEKRLKLIRGQPPRRGMRLATVSLYAAGEDMQLPHWVEFFPYPIECATTNLDAIETAFERIDQDDWDELKEWLSDVPRPFQTGLFTIPGFDWDE